MGDADAGSGSSGLGGRLAQEMSPSSMLQRNRVSPKVWGWEQQRALSHRTLGHTDNCKPTRPHCPYGGCSEHSTTHPHPPPALLNQ